MTDSAPPRFHIDAPAGWQPAQAEIEITGWLYAAGGCGDIRARVDKRVTLGLYGLDRPDIQAAFDGSLASRRTGFRLPVQVWRGASALALDYHDGTQWREFFRTALDTSLLPADDTKPTRVLRAAVVYQTLHYLYRHFHRASWGTLCREADAVLAEVLTANSDVAIGDGLLGHVENPGYWVNVTYEKFRVTGWVFGIGHDLVQLNGTTGVITENRLVYPKDRPDVASHKADHANALRSGYYGLVDIRKDTPSPANLLVFAETADGRRSSSRSSSTRSSPLSSAAAYSAASRSTNGTTPRPRSRASAPTSPPASATATRRSCRRRSSAAVTRIRTRAGAGTTASPRACARSCNRMPTRWSRSAARSSASWCRPTTRRRNTCASCSTA
jgi:hypothetical protein